MTALYSEFDPKAAAWLRELIKQGHIADGVVDERDLWDIPADYLRDFTQVHLCAGIGVWSYALRRAGWEDTRECWTGSFPCQPFSAAGKGLGFADERHLWPAGEHIIRQCRPRVVFGEQVASKDAEHWLDAVQADLEALGYAFGACAFPSAGIGAPHIRDRTYWVADAVPAGRSERRPSAGRGQTAGGSGSDRLADAEDKRHEWGGSARGRRAGPAHDSTIVGLADDDDDARLEGRGQPGRERAAERPVGAGGVAGGVADAKSGGKSDQPERHEPGVESRAPVQFGVNYGANGGVGGRHDTAGGGAGAAFSGDTNGVGSTLGGSGPTNGLWRAADWLLCRDGKWRPVEPGTFPLAHGAPARVGRLRGYGNAVNAEAAVAWIEAYLEAKGERTFAGGAEEADQVQT